LIPKPRFTISSNWGCSPENIRKLTGTVLDEMKKIKENGPSDIDLGKVKETLIRDRETRIKENSFWLSALQNHYLYGDRILTLEEYRNFINSFTAGDIKAIANKYLDTEKYVEVELTPAEKAETK